MDNARAPDIAALVGARICHDLAGVLGALGNGIEVLGEAGGSGAELEMVADTASEARNRLAMLRIAFAPADDADSFVAPAMLRSIAQGLNGASRLTLGWTPADTALPRPRVRLAVLLAMCTASAMPRGATLHIKLDADALALHAQGTRCTLDPALWDCLDGASAPPVTLRPAQVHFAVAAQVLQHNARALSLQQPEPGTLVLRC